MNSNEQILSLVIKYKGNWDKVFSAIKSQETCEDNESVIEQYKGKYITILDKQYPECLKQGCYKPPFVLFYEGNIGILNDKNYDIKLAISDSRSLTETEKGIVNDMLTNVPDNTAFVLGGEGNMTDDIVKTHTNPVIMVLAYSPEQYGYVGLKRHIIANGGVIISEYPDNAFNDLKNENFVNRYRIMTALGTDVLITKAKQHSGSTTMVMSALQQGKDVMVIPTSPAEKELVNNKLIAEGAIPVYDNDSLTFNLQASY